MTILPLAYLPSVEYFAHLLCGGCVVDLGEHFVKRSERNRARILATDGVMAVSYTHLDVYKRQVLKRPMLRIFFVSRLMYL